MFVISLPPQDFELAATAAATSNDDVAITSAAAVNRACKVLRIFDAPLKRCHDQFTSTIPHNGLLSQRFPLLIRHKEIDTLSCHGAPSIRY